MPHDEGPFPNIPAPAVPEPLVRIIRAGARANREVPNAVAVGGTVCAMYARHRLSRDIDFAVGDLREHFDEVREHLRTLDGWTESSARPPVLILGSLDGVEIGFRQLRRAVPLETVTVETGTGPMLVPTLDELLRIKAFLAYDRNVLRDFVDFAELSVLLPDAAVVGALADLDAKFSTEKQPSVIVGVLKTLLHPEPADQDGEAFGTFRWLEPRLKSWSAVEARCRDIGEQLSLRLLQK